MKLGARTAGGRCISGALPTEQRDREVPGLSEGGSWMYRLKGISKAFYNSRGECVAKGCDEISLTLERGDFVAITGESGSGKSTLLSLLGFLATPNPSPSYGQFIFRAGGREYDLADALKRGIGSSRLSQWRADHIGFVFQNYHLMNHLTGSENVGLGVRFASPRRETDRPAAVLSALGMAPFLKKRARDLSGGQKQRISVARALVKKPDVLLADEPTGNLDTANKCLVLASLLIANRRYGATVILVTHEIEHPPLIASRSIVMRDGRIVQDKRLTPSVDIEPDDTVQKLARKLARQGYPDILADLKFD
jgi:putative ABC transport system ATP-binding protein